MTRWRDHSAMALAGLAAFGLAGGACKEQVEDTIPDLPSDSDPVETDTGPIEIPIDTSVDTGLDIVPDHWLYLYQEGTLNLSPGGGPYTALVGTVEFLELQDFELPDPAADTGAPDTGLPWQDNDTATPDPLRCRVVYAMVGAPALDTCSGCNEAWEIEFNVSEGDPNACWDREAPQDGETRTFAFSPAEGALYFDFHDTGVWFPWWSAAAAGDSIAFEWKHRYALSIEEEDTQ